MLLIDQKQGRFTQSIQKKLFSSWGCVQFITGSKRLTDAWANLNCKFNSSPSLECSLIQFNWTHSEALDCKMQSHHVISAHSVACAPATQQHFHNGLIIRSSQRILLLLFFLFFFSTRKPTSTTISTPSIDTEYVCVCLSEMLRCVFIAPSLSKERTLVWKTWCMKEAVSGLCRTVRLSGVKGAGKTRAARG